MRPVVSTGTCLVFDLTGDPGKTLLRFSHADWQAETDYLVACTATWGELMYRLKATAEAKSPGPLEQPHGDEEISVGKKGTTKPRQGSKTQCPESDRQIGTVGDYMQNCIA